ncbi:hypothetical protein [Tardibacter chloracetimidivorans]|uniref:hypothetical protein n=1 Tax=Tardibacter chloracetimidivorans TaxID=1921510 RepID=UPI001301475D|nr:hypothetical protein [Tardibacter chloracetimidivorans]
MINERDDGRCPECGEDEMDGARCYYCGFHDYNCGICDKCTVPQECAQASEDRK